MNKRRFGTLAAVAVLTVSACGGSTASTAPSAATSSAAASGAAPSTAASKGEIHIWSSLPMQGASKLLSDTEVNAINLALQERNFTVGGYTVVYTPKDDSTATAGQWDPSTEIKNANDAVADDKLIAYLGTANSGAAKLSIPILCGAGIPMISPQNTYPGLTTSAGAAPGEPDKYYPNGCKRNYTRTAPSDNMVGTAAPKWAATLGVKTVYALDDTGTYGKGVTDVFKAAVPGAGLQLLGSDGIDPKASDYKALAAKIQSLNPDLVWFGGDVQSNVGQLWRDLRGAMPNVKLMGPDGLYGPSFVEAAGAAAEGTYLASGALDPAHLTDTGAAFIAKYNAAYPDQPAQSWTTYAYEAINVILAGIDKAAATNPADFKALRAATLDAIANTKNFNGALGTWSFDQNGDTDLTAMTGLVVKGGQFSFLGTITGK